MSALLKVLLVVATILVASQAEECTDFTWTSSVDFAEYENCTSFNGTVLIDGSDLHNLTFLTNVTSVNVLTIQNNVNLTAITLAKLATASGAVEIKNNVEVTSVDFAGLTTTGAVTISGLPKVATFALPQLAKVEGNLNVDGVTVTAAALTNVTGAFSVSNVQSATAYNFPALLAAVGGDVTFKNNLATSVAAPALAAVTGTLEITANNAATSISFPELTQLAELQVQGQALTTVTFAKLNKTSVTKFLVPKIKCNKTAEFYAQVNSTAPAEQSCDDSTSVTCELPVAPVNGTIPATFNNTHGAPAQTVFCNNGSVVTGPARVCLANGTWDQPAQTCTACVAGKYKNGTDAVATCTECADNFAAPLAGMSFCGACPNNSWSGAATGHASHEFCYCKYADKYYVYGDPKCEGKTSGASSVMALPALVLAAFAAVAMMVRA